MKAVSISALLSAAIGAIDVDTSVSTYGTVQGSVARRSVMNYVMGFPSINDLSGPDVGEVLVQTGWVLIPELEDTPVFHFGFDIYRLDSASIDALDLGLFWAFPVASLDAATPKWEFGLLHKNIGSEVEYLAGLATSFSQTLTTGGALQITVDEETPSLDLTYVIGTKGAFSLTEASQEVYSSQPTNYWNIDTSMSRLVTSTKLSLVLSRTDVSNIGLKAG